MTWRKWIGWPLSLVGAVLLLPGASSALGGTFALRFDFGIHVTLNEAWLILGTDPQNPGAGFGFLAFNHWGVQTFASSPGGTFFIVGRYLVMVLGAAFLGAGLLCVIHRRPFLPPLCFKCGYNREGVPADSPCPECGRQQQKRVGA